jgi:DNA-binding CsgD family transcriptional regulator
MTQQGLEADIAWQLMDVIDVPLCVFDEDMSVVWANESARLLFDEADTSPSALAPRLREAVRAATDWEGGKTELTLPGAPDTRVRLFKLPGGKRTFVAGRFSQSGAAPPGEPAERLAALGLTRTESRIAAAMLCGGTAVEIAEANRIALQTVRTHLKHIYTKLGVNCREKMFARISR